jgi:heme oxygenase
VEILRNRVNRNLDRLPLSDEERREVVQEARLAFRLDTLLCDALARESLGVSSSNLG